MLYGVWASITGKEALKLDYWLTFVGIFIGIVLLLSH